MWNLQSCNKLIQKRSLQKNYEKHRKNVQKMEPRIKIQNPYQPDFIYRKDKLNMSRRDRRIEIDRLNSILLIKMESIKDAPYYANKLRPEAQNLKTLNAHTMDVINEHIATENQRFCQKLMKTKTFYPTSTILEKTDQLEYIRSNISFNARRAMSATNLNTQRSRPRSNYTTNLSSQKRKSIQNLRLLAGLQKKRSAHSLRPQTAPLGSRSDKKLPIPQSGRPRIQSRQQNNEQ